MSFGGLGDQLKKLGVTDDQVKKASGLLGSNAALVGKAEGLLGGKADTAAPAPGAGAAPPAAPAGSGTVDSSSAATATVAAAAVAGGDAQKPATPPAGGAPQSDTIHKVCKHVCFQVLFSNFCRGMDLMQARQHFHLAGWNVKICMLRECLGIQGLDLFAEMLSPRLHHLNVLLQFPIFVTPCLIVLLFMYFDFAYPPVH
jgi:hypothetical protein